MPSSLTVAAATALAALTTLLATLAAGLPASSPATKPSPAPWFCHGLECPSYKSVGTGGGTDGRPASSPATKPAPAPWFCHGLECPAYKSIGTGGGTDGRPAYEVRAYERSVWASTRVEAYTLATAQARGFQRLFAYISGGNEGNVTIPMTAPVLTSLPLPAPAGPFCAANFTVSFLVPAAHRSRPPRPSDPAIFISTLPAGSFYVASRGGWAWESDAAVARGAAAPVDAARADGRPASLKKGVPWFVAGYDPPFRLRGRHTEVWVGVPPEDEGGEGQQPLVGVA
jgi:hypothetical protein